MKNSMALLCFICMLVCLPCSVQSKDKRKGKDVFRYEIIPVGVGSQGTTLLKVFSYAKNEKKAIELAKKNAVHGVLFKGIAGGNGVSPQAPLVTFEEYESHCDFFYDFFDNGIYMQFVNLSSDGISSPDDMVREGSMYKIGIEVSVKKASLRKYLEENNIINKLGSIF